MKKKIINLSMEQVKEIKESEEMIIDSIDKSDKNQLNNDLSFNSESSIENINDDLNEYDINLDDYDGLLSSTVNSNEIVPFSIYSNNKNLVSFSSSNLFVNKKRNISTDEIPKSIRTIKTKRTLINDDFLLKLQENNNNENLNFNLLNDSLFSYKLDPRSIVSFISQIFYSNILKSQGLKFKNKKLALFNEYDFDKLQDDLIDKIYPFYKDLPIKELINFLESSQDYNSIFNQQGIKFLDEIKQINIYPKINEILNLKTDLFVQIYLKIKKKDKKFKQKIEIENVSSYYE